jgi:hypothetical protein
MFSAAASRKKQARYKFFLRFAAALGNVQWALGYYGANCAFGLTRRTSSDYAARVFTRLDLSCTSPKIFARHGGQAERADVTSRHGKQAKVHGVRSAAWPRHQMRRNIHATRTCHLPSIRGRGSAFGRASRHVATTLLH